MLLFRPLLLISLAGLLVSCAGSNGGPTIEEPPYSTNREIVRLELTPTFVSIGPAESQALVALAVYDDEETVDVTDLVEWVVPDEYADLLTVEEGVLLPLGVGWAQLYAVLGPVASNLVTAEVGQFGYAVTSLHWNGTTHDPDDSIPQGNLVRVTVEVTGRTLDAERPDLIDLQIDGFVPFGPDRPEQGLEPYFQVVDDVTYEGWFLVPPPLPSGGHAVTLTVEGVVGDTEDFLTVSSNVLPPKTCDELAADSTLDPFDERKYRMDFGEAGWAHRLEAEDDAGTGLDTALWLFDGDAELFAFTDTPFGGGSDARLDVGITEPLRGTYYLVLTASPYAGDELGSEGDFVLSCDSEQITGEEIEGSTEVVVPAGGGPVELTLEAPEPAGGPLVERAWVHADVETDVPGLVTIVLRAPDTTLSVGLRATGHDEQRAAVTWGTLVEPDDPLYDLTRFAATDAAGTWTLEIEDHSSAGNTLLHDWRLYIQGGQEAPTP